MNKRGFLMLSLFIFTIIAVGIALYVSSTISNVAFSENLGDIQLGVMNNSNLIYEELYFKNEILKSTAGDSVFELGNVGGIFDGELVDGYNVWYRGGKECWPNEDSLTENYILVLEDKMDLYEQSDYNLKIEKEDSGFIKIISELEIYNEILKDDYNVSTFSDESLTYTLEYNFDDFETKVKNIRDDILVECSDDSACWEEKKNSRNWFKSLDVNGKVFKFKLVSDSVGGEEVIIKGAIDFNEGNLEC